MGSRAQNPGYARRVADLAVAKINEVSMAMNGREVNARVGADNSIVSDMSTRRATTIAAIRPRVATGALRAILADIISLAENGLTVTEIANAADRPNRSCVIAALERMLDDGDVMRKREKSDRGQYRWRFFIRLGNGNGSPGN